MPTRINTRLESWRLLSWRDTRNDEMAARNTDYVASSFLFFIDTFGREEEKKNKRTKKRKKNGENDKGKGVEDAGVVGAFRSGHRFQHDRADEANEQRWYNEEDGMPYGIEPTLYFSLLSAGKVGQLSNLSDLVTDLPDSSLMIERNKTAWSFGGGEEAAACEKLFYPE